MDSSVEYVGPRAAFATLGGSPTWGLGDRFHELAASRGHTRLGLHRPPTPYGLGPEVEHYRGPSGREFLRIPTYGQVVDEDPQLHASEWKTFWILWKAGVRVLLVGGTSGSCDWRRTAADEDAVRPGDLVLPKSYLTRDTMPTRRPAPRSSSAFRARSRSWTIPSARARGRAALARRRVRFPIPADPRPGGGRGAEPLARRRRFESLATCRMLEASGRLIGMPVITGDCVSPVLARVCGMHLAYYHVIANWGTGLEPDDPTITLNRLYMETLPAVAATLELGFLDEVSEPATCRCRELLRARPPEYARALSPPAPK
jgi:hypothetical protein